MIDNIMEKTKHSCSACGACAAICPTEAIQLKIDSAGFFTAIVQEESCIQCGLCRKVCSRFEEAKGRISLHDAKLYALQSSNMDTVQKCSSGGAAHELAAMAVRKKYKVVGVVYDEDTDHAIHEVIGSAKDIQRLDGSKYLQSNPSRAFRKAVLEAQENKENCFFVFGTPCQIAGLDRVLRQHKIRNQFLLTEIFCHGVPSYRLWEESCKKIKKRLNTDMFDSVLFRYKKNDWHSYCLKVTAGGKVYYGARETELFWQVFFENILLGDACYECNARKDFSSADLRIGDYWGARFQNHTDGVSAVYACTEQGEKVIEELVKEKRFQVLQEGDASDMLAAQNMAGYTQKRLHNEAMKALRENGDIDAAVRYYRKRMPVKQKVKRILLEISAVIPDGIRAKLRKANSSRLLKR